MKCPIVTFGATIVLSAMTLAACQPIPAPTIEAEATQAAPAPTHSPALDSTEYANVYVYTIEESENDGRSQLHISYPVMEQDAINARMEEVSQQFIDEYRTTAAEIEKSFQEYKKETGKEAATFVTQYRQSFDVTVANENIIFFAVTRSIYTGGTGNEFVLGYIFDRRNGVELTLPDLFVDDRYLERLSDLTREALGERARIRNAKEDYDSDAARKESLQSSLDWIQEGTAPTAENFDNILFQENGTVLVRFDKYQVAAGVEGVVEVELPLVAIAELLKPEIGHLLDV